MFAQRYGFHVGRMLLLQGRAEAALPFLRSAVAAKESWSHSRFYLGYALVHIPAFIQEGTKLLSESFHVLKNTLLQVMAALF